MLIPIIPDAWMQVESETVKARSPLAATSRPGIADLDASSAPGPSRLGQQRRSAYAEPEEHAEAHVTEAQGSAQHDGLDAAGVSDIDGPSADSMQSEHPSGGYFSSTAAAVPTCTYSCSS